MSDQRIRKAIGQLPVNAVGGDTDSFTNAVNELLGAGYL